MFDRPLVLRTVSHLWKPSATGGTTPCTGRMTLPHCWLLFDLVGLFKVGLLESIFFFFLRIVECLYIVKEKERKKERKKVKIRGKNGGFYSLLFPCSPELYMLFRKHLLWLRISTSSICSDPASSSELSSEVGSSLRIGSPGGYEDVGRTSIPATSNRMCRGFLCEELNDHLNCCGSALNHSSLIVWISHLISSS
jgi:hypothetical protein